jgi:hypothetical protein
MRGYDIFLAVSYKPACVERSAYRLAIESILKQADRTGLTVYVAPAMERWGLSRPPRREALAQDHSALRECICFVYFVGGFESDGALVELGIALALRKRIIILRWESETVSSHVRGFIEIGAAEEGIITASDEPFSLLLALISASESRKARSKG